MNRLWLACFCALGFSGAAQAQTAQVLSGGCGTAGYSNTKGVAQLTQDTTGTLCATSTAPVGGATSANQVTGNASLATIATNSAGASTAANQTTANTSLATIATNSAFGGTKTFVALDASSVVTGGVAVTALSAGHRTKGGFLVNPSGAVVDLCINEQTTASGTTTAGALICISHGQSYQLQSSALGVSVISSDSSHTFGGQGYN